jgi:uncharacterized protein YndB with AHSA1/START domain
MAVNTHTVIFIDHPPDRVFAALTDVAHHSEWATASVAIRNVSDSPAKLGTTWDQSTVFMSRQVETHFQVTTYDPNLRFSYKTDEPFFTALTFSLDPAPQGTKLTFEVRMELKGFWGLTAPLVSNALKNQMHQDLERLRVRL